jgi:hypothetical protein
MLAPAVQGVGGDHGPASSSGSSSGAKQEISLILPLQPHIPAAMPPARRQLRAHPPVLPARHRISTPAPPVHTSLADHDHHLEMLNVTARSLSACKLGRGLERRETSPRIRSPTVKPLGSGVTLSRYRHERNHASSPVLAAPSFRPLALLCVDHRWPAARAAPSSLRRAARRQRPTQTSAERVLTYRKNHLISG